MYKIGDFSKMSGLSIETLYHYENIKLLLPEYIDKATHYRYYAPNQFVTVNKILAFKDAGFSLEEIAGILKDNPSTSDLIEILENKIITIEDMLTKEEQRLKRIKTNVFLIKNGGIPQLNDISIKKVNPILVASFRDKVPRGKERQLEPIWEKLKAYITRNGGRLATSSMVIYHNVENIMEFPETVDIEVVEPITKAIEPGDGISVYELDPVNQMACIVHNGSLSRIHETYKIMADWLKENNYAFDKSVREIYHAGACKSNDEADHFTELQFPLTGNA